MARKRQQSTKRALKRGSAILIGNDTLGYTLQRKVNSTKMAESTKRLIRSGKIRPKRSENFFKKVIIQWL